MTSQVAIGLYLMTMALIGQWYVLRAIARATARVAARWETRVIAGWSAIARAWRSWVADREKRRAWRRDVQARLQAQTVHTLTMTLAELRAEIAELRTQRPESDQCWINDPVDPKRSRSGCERQATKG